MRRSSIAALLVLVGTMISPQIARADVIVSPTNLNIQVQAHSITGSLVGKKECRGGQQIDLYVNGVLTSSTTTDASGNYVFSYTAVPPTNVQTRFPGSETGAHPNRLICTPSSSRIVQVNKANGSTTLSTAADSLALGVEAAVLQTVSAISLLV